MSTEGPSKMKSVTDQSLGQNQDNTTPPSQPVITDAELRELAMTPKRPGRPRNAAFDSDAKTIYAECGGNSYKTARILEVKYDISKNASYMRVRRLVKKWKACP